MKAILILVMLMLPKLSFAKDNYDAFHDYSHWKDTVKIEKNISIKSSQKMSDDQANHILTSYKKIYEDFEQFFKIDLSKCPDRLEVRIISVKDLSNKKYFPHEDDYTDVYGKVNGRYFRNSKTLYIIPNNNHIEWKVLFAHELAHHFFNTCDIEFENNELEHNYIFPFQESFRNGCQKKS